VFPSSLPYPGQNSDSPKPCNLLVPKLFQQFFKTAPDILRFLEGSAMRLGPTERNDGRWKMEDGSWKSEDALVSRHYSSPVFPCAGEPRRPVLNLRSPLSSSGSGVKLPVKLSQTQSNSLFCSGNPTKLIEYETTKRLLPRLQVSSHRTSTIGNRTEHGGIRRLDETAADCRADFGLWTSDFGL
jgi:hypothetical protein